MNSFYDPGLTTPEDLLNRYTTLTGWSEALLDAGASAVGALQLFGHDAEVQHNGVRYVFRRLSLSSWAWSVRQIVAEAAPDIVHVNGLIFPWQTWWLRRVLPRHAAIVVQDHGGVQPGRNPYRLMRQRIGLSAADAFMFSALELSRPWREAGLIAPRQPVHAVMESSTTMKPWPRFQAGSESGISGSPALLWVGRLNANKDPLTVLNGLEGALNKLPAARLTMVYSEDDWLPQVQERLAGSAALSSRVQLRGYITQDRLPAFYSAADLFVSGSHREGSGYALIEAVACGLTPIVTDIPSFRAITGKGRIGKLWPAGNADALAGALAGCVVDELRGARAAIRNHFERELSWPVIGRRAMDVYAEVSARRRKGM